jgi:hypothetical protein
MTRGLVESVKPDMLVATRRSDIGSASMVAKANELP